MLKSVESKHMKICTYLIIFSLSFMFMNYYCPTQPKNFSYSSKEIRCHRFFWAEAIQKFGGHGRTRPIHRLPPRWCGTTLRARKEAGSWESAGLSVGESSLIPLGCRSKKSFFYYGCYYLIVRMYSNRRGVHHDVKAIFNQSKMDSLPTISPSHRPTQ